MTRGWLPSEVDRLVTAYKAKDWAGVHATIDRMLELDRDGAVILTLKEAHTAAAWYTGDLRDDYVDELGLARRLETARSHADQTSA